MIQQPGLAARIWAWFRGLYSRTLGVIALALVAFFVFVEPPPIWPFTTGGRIYVESPGVYTRERLVNDRYAQDFWLKTQLARLDASADLVREYRQSSFGLGTAPEAETPPEAALPFQDDFLLRAAIRDKIRQMVLENLLDDRHDLTGNSIYGLKFDTAIVPGANTRLRPYVVVRIGAETLPQGKGAVDFLGDPASANNSATGGDFDATLRQYNDWRRNVESRLNGYLEQAAAQACAEPPPAGPVATAVVLAEGAPDKAAAFGPPAPAQSVSIGVGGERPPGDGWPAIDRSRIVDALRQVLGVEPREIAFAPWQKRGEFGTIEIPEPWSRYFQMQVGLTPDVVGVDEACGRGFNLQLKPVFATLLVVEQKAYQDFIETAAQVDQPQVRLIRGVSEAVSDRLVLIQQWQAGGLWRAFPGEQAFIQSLAKPELLRLLGRAQKEREVCFVFATGVAELDGAPTPPIGTCLLTGDSYTVHASQYDFIRAVSQSSPYSYAVFPRGDVEGVLTDRTLAGGLDGGEGGLGLSALTRTRSAGAEPVVVNFAGGRSPSVTLGDFDFGWAVVRPGRQRPSQLSQLVLVSVPAYLDKLDLWVETGWLDRNSDPIGPPPADPPAMTAAATAPSPGQARPEATGAADGAAEIVETRVGERRITRMRVSLPPDYEAIDTLVVGGTRRQGPVIDELYFENRRPTVVACRRAEILIPGERLWRSTSVTLGGQIADRITVMPDMRGIVAAFEAVAMPPTPEGSRSEKLAVWTSEGRDELGLPVEVRVPAEAAEAGRCPPDPAPAAAP